MQRRHDPTTRSSACRFAVIMRRAIIASWTLAMIAFWVSWLASPGAPVLTQFYAGSWVVPFAILFFPLNPLLVVGFKRFSKLLAETEWTDAGTEFQPPQSKSIGGMLDPASDPLDPRSGVNWIGHPSKIAELFGRRWP